MKRSRILSAILALVLAAAVLPGLTVSAGAAAKEPEITVSVFVGEPGDQPAGNNKIYKQIQNKLRIKFKFEFLSGDPEETLNRMIEEKRYPDLWCGGSSGEALEKAGVLIDLLPLITEEDTPNLYRHIYTNNRVRQMLSDDGRLYIIPSSGVYYNGGIQNANGPAFFIQKQVIEWNDYRVPGTLNEYFDLIERFAAANPRNEAGEEYTGFAIMCEDWRNYCLTSPVQYLMGHPNDGDVLIDNTAPDYHTETYIDKPYAKAYYAKLNEAYHKGLIKEETFTWTYDQYIEKLSSGTVLGLFDQAGDIDSAVSALRDAGMYGHTYIALPLVYDPEYAGGKEITEHYLSAPGLTKGRGFGISTACEYPERLVQMLDTLLSDEWQVLFQWGTKGSNYSVKNGRMLMNKGQFGKLSDSKWRLANKADALFGALPKKQGAMDDGNSWDPELQPENQQYLLDDYDNKLLKKIGKLSWNDFFNPPGERPLYGEGWMIDYTPAEVEHSNFAQIQAKWLPELIMADASGFDRMWDSFTEVIGISAGAFADYMQKEVLRLVEKNSAPVVPVDSSAADGNGIRFLGLSWGCSYKEASALLAGQSLVPGKPAAESDGISAIINKEIPLADCTAFRAALYFSCRKGENQPEEHSSFQKGELYFFSDVPVNSIIRSVTQAYGLDEGTNLGSIYAWKKENVRFMLSAKDKYIVLEVFPEDQAGN